MISRRKRASAIVLIALIQGSQWLLQIPETWRTLSIQFAISATVFGLILLRDLLRKGGSRPPLGGILLGITFDLLPWLLLSWAGQRLAAGVVPVALCSVPLLLALDSQSSFLRNFSIAGIAGMVLAASSALELRADQWPRLLALGAAIALLAFSFAYARRLLVSGVPLAPLLFVEHATAAAAFWLFSLRLPSPHLAAAPPLAALLISALAVNTAAAWLTWWLLAQRDAVRVAALVWPQMVVTLSLSAFLLRQQPGWLMFAGAALMLVSFLALWRQDGKETLIFRVTPAS